MNGYEEAARILRAKWLAKEANLEALELVAAKPESPADWCTLGKNCDRVCRLTRELRDVLGPLANRLEGDREVKAL